MIERVELYLDGAPKAFTWLEQPPYHLDLDTGSFSAGPHSLRLLTVHTDGRTNERTVNFSVQHQQSMTLAALADGTVLHSRVRLEINDSDLSAESAAVSPVTSNVPGWVLPLSAVVLLGGIWGFFAFFMGNGSNTPDPAVMAQGKTVYAASCAGCHNTDGSGTPEYAPPLAENTNLKDARHVVTTIIKGLSGGVEVRGQKYSARMPAISDLSDAEVAAVSTFVRNSWGNAFDPVSEAYVKTLR